MGPILRLYIESLASHVIAQHQLLGIRTQIHLLVYPTLRWAPPLNPGAGRHPVGHRVVVAVSPFYKTGHKRQKPFVLMNRTPILP